MALPAKARRLILPLIARATLVAVVPMVAACAGSSYSPSSTYPLYAAAGPYDPWYKAPPSYQRRVAPPRALAAPSPPAAVLNIESAYYGTLRGERVNALKQVQAACQNQPACDLGQPMRSLRDTQPGVEKSLVVSYRCGRGERHTVRIADRPGAGLGC